MGWTEERVELLRKLWLEGLSASQIAGVLGEGVTRNAVIGKVHRLKLSGRAKPTAAPRVRTTPRPATAATPGPARRLASPSTPRPAQSPMAQLMKNRPMPPALSGGGGGAVQGATALKLEPEMDVDLNLAPSPAELVIPVEQRLTLLQLSEQTCKWPIGDPLAADFYFCGQHSLEGKPYCEFHARRAFHQIDKKKR